ncbi:hypothetical protein RJT34_20659 [Clitoria ternatea]|uniref:Protein kinase domain-containing protein n=1 Tax=Clitoria ternatea TaxID=43366 RepID=A0AAN9P567_CLITE
MHEEKAQQKKQQEYELLEELGRGRFGTVFRCFHKTSNKFHAAKLIDKRLLTDSTDRQCIEIEPKVMTFLSPHPNILQIIDAFDDSDFSSIVLELCHPSTLLDRIADGAFSEAHACWVMRQLLEAVAHCHRVGVAHRDIKPDNVLFDWENHVKLSDFGSAEWLGEGGSMSGVVGTPCYVAPEVVLGREYSEKVDVWSCGVVLYTMLAGVPPFYGDSAVDIFEAVVRANLRFPTRIFRSVSSSVKDLIKKMICRDPSGRISAEQALRHPWILNGGD